MEAELMRLHLEWIAAGTGTTVATTTEVTALTGAGFLAPIIAVFFFLLVWWGVPVMEWFVKQLYKAVDKLYDFWH